MITLNSGLTLGKDSPIRINCNVGCNSIEGYTKEVTKLRMLKSQNVLPDMMMDLSLVELKQPLYHIIRDELKLPFGTVLSYHGFTKSEGLQWNTVKDKFCHLCAEGVAFVTVHFTADADLFDRAKKERLIPMTSRGGGIVLYDTNLNHRSKNVFLEHIDDIAEMALTSNVAISLGTTFRPATIQDACDSVHMEETVRQLEICRYLQSKGVKVMVENIGHISLDKIEEHSKLLRQFNAPIMPLGPLPTDMAINQDHIANAIGASFSAYLGCTHVINCVTRYEHSESAITPEVTIEAIRTARLAAHAVDLAHKNQEAIEQDEQISRIRAHNHSCFADSRECTRCSIVCPLKLKTND